MRARKPSAIVTRAQGRAARLAAIDPNLDLGHGVSLAALTAAIDDCRATVEEYNRLIAAADALRGQLRKKDARLWALHSAMLAAVGAAFGKDSAEYQKAGGVRTSERKRPARRERGEPQPTPDVAKTAPRTPGDGALTATGASPTPPADRAAPDSPARPSSASAPGSRLADPGAADAFTRPPTGAQETRNSGEREVLAPRVQDAMRSGFGL